MGQELKDEINTNRKQLQLSATVVRNTSVDRCWKLLDYIRRVVRLDTDLLCELTHAHCNYANNNSFSHTLVYKLSDRNFLY